MLSIGAKYIYVTSTLNYPQFAFPPYLHTKPRSALNLLPNPVDVDCDSLKCGSVLLPCDESQQPPLVSSRPRQNSPHLDPLDVLSLLTHQRNFASSAVQIRTIVDQGKDTPLIEIFQMLTIEQHRPKAGGTWKIVDCGRGDIGASIDLQGGEKFTGLDDGDNVVV